MTNKCSDCGGEHELGINAQGICFGCMYEGTSVLYRNQCDGCARGLPLVKSKFSIRPHHKGEEPWDLIGCTRHLYT